MGLLNSNLSNSVLILKIICQQKNRLFPLFYLSSFSLCTLYSMSQPPYPQTCPLNSNKPTNNQKYTPIEKNSQAQIDLQFYQVTPTITIHKVQDVQSVDQHNQKYSIHLEQNQQHQAYQQNFEFKVCVHQVSSKQSLSQDGCHQKYSINFTKSQINIPIQFIGQADQHKNLHISNRQKQNINHTYFSQKNYLYVRNLQQKQTKKQQEEAEINKFIQSQQINYQQSKNKMQPKNKCFQVKPQQNQIKKIKFKIKKLVDRSNFSTANLKASKTPAEIKVCDNRSKVANLQQNQANKPYGYNRLNKKHVSNVESENKSSQKSLFRKETKQNVQYQISLNNSVQMIRHILEDKCSNSLDQKDLQQIDQDKNGQYQSPNRLRKVIKRSPYGILEIEVKDKKTTAKITNLKILKPKEIIRLKKIPNIVKANKQNFVQKSTLYNHVKNSLKSSYKQSNITEILSGLLALN